MYASITSLKQRIWSSIYVYHMRGCTGQTSAPMTDLSDYTPMVMKRIEKVMRKEGLGRLRLEHKHTDIMEIFIGRIERRLQL